jgi:UDP-N-acetylglucosamine--N-acetylmuramyl-(pentapeptide) pyrophosphoryl-undecaprenol N-acetylglucosamine transferase
LSLDDGSTLYRLREGIERFLITDINNPASSAQAQSGIQVMWDRFSTRVSQFSHVPGGANVLYLDGHVSFSRFGDKPVLLILGGSEGVHEINSLVLEVLPDLLAKYEIIHQCGLAEYEYIQSRVRGMNIPFLDDYHLFPFLRQNFPKAYAACDLVVSRAGANTVAEIMLVGKPSILIPSSEEGSDDQNHNAFFFSEAGAAVLINEKNLKPHLFMETVDNIFKHKLKVMEMMRAARQLAHPEAAETVADEIIKLSR